MPRLLQPGACCPQCGRAILATFRTMNNERTVYEFIHRRKTRKGSCFENVPAGLVKQYEQEIYDPLHVIPREYTGGLKKALVF